MVRPKDPFWKYAKNLKNGRFSCNFCHGQFAGGITRIKWHLSGHTSHDIKVCEQVPRDIRLAVRQVLDTPNKKDGQVEDENCSVPSSSGCQNLCKENDNVLMGQNDNNNLLELNRAPNSSNEKDKCQLLLDKQLAKWSIVYGIDPVAIVSPIFKDFVKSIGEFGPSYQLPSPDGLLGDVVFDVAREVKEYVENFINDQVQADCTLMVNLRYDRKVFMIAHVVEIFAYSQRGAVCLKSFYYDPQAKRIPDFISSAIQLLGPNRLIQLLISYDYGGWDNFSREIKNHHPWIHASKCVTREIGEFLDELRRKLHPTIRLVELIFYTYQYYKVSSIREMKVPVELSALILLILKSILKIEDELQDVSFSSIIESSNQVKLLDDEQEKAKHFRCAELLDYIIGHKEFWTRVKAVAQVWGLLFQAQCLVNQEDSSIGYLYQIIERLKDGIEKSREYDCFIYDCTWESFSNMREKIIHPIHAAAAFLDPAYMYIGNFEINAEMMDGINYMFENMVDPNENEAFTKELQKYRMKLPELFTAQAITMLKTCHPRIWWDFCGKHTLPILRKYAIRILSQPCSTSFCKCYQMSLGDGILIDQSIKVNAMIKNGNSISLKLEPVILDKLGEDCDTFSEKTDEEAESFQSCIYFLSQLTNNALVDCVINDSSPFWDNVKKNMHFLHDYFC